jgi:2-oxoglutarate dehydrogenase E2 component (dihydrolipoamide succinyltransferase)
MKEEILIPSMGESITEAMVGAFLQPTGATVKEGEELIELETAKVNQVLYAPCAGVLTWTTQVGARVTIGESIGYIEKNAKPASAKQSQPLPIQKSAPPPPVSPGITSSPEGRESRRRMTSIRQTIANRLVEALHTAAMLTTFNEVDMTRLMALRKEEQERFTQKNGSKLGLLSFFVKAVAESLKEFPDFNSYLSGEEIVTRHYCDISIAVATEKGLTVPVLRNSDQLSFADIEKKLAEYATKARTGKLSIQDVEGGGFTITNGGVYGSLLSTPILNPPQVGILGMHKILPRPVVIENAVVIRQMMYLALSYDHRVIDGKEAVGFLVNIKEKLENPEALYKAFS